MSEAGDLFASRSGLVAPLDFWGPSDPGCTNAHADPLSPQCERHLFCNACNNISFTNFSPLRKSFKDCRRISLSEARLPSSGQSRLPWLDAKVPLHATEFSSTSSSISSRANRMYGHRSRGLVKPFPLEYTIRMAAVCEPYTAVCRRGRRKQRAENQEVIIAPRRRCTCEIKNRGAQRTCCADHGLLNHAHRGEVRGHEKRSNQDTELSFL